MKELKLKLVLNFVLTVVLPIVITICIGIVALAKDNFWWFILWIAFLAPCLLVYDWLECKVHVKLSEHTRDKILSEEHDETQNAGKMVKKYRKVRSSPTKVLVIVDMQNDFLTGALGNKECEAVIPEVVKLIKSGDYDVIVTTQDSHKSNYLNTQEGKKLPVPHCIVGTEGHAIQKDILEAILDAKENGTEYINILKDTFGADIVDELDFEDFSNLEEIHFCGVCTGICVISNVLIAKKDEPEAKICVVERACACVTPESHKTAIEAMKTCQIDII